jgi:hypothetical protein
MAAIHAQQGGKARHQIERGVGQTAEHGQRAGRHHGPDLEAQQEQGHGAAGHGRPAVEVGVSESRGGAGARVVAGSVIAPAIRSESVEANPGLAFPVHPEAQSTPEVMSGIEQRARPAARAIGDEAAAFVEAIVAVLPELDGRGITR